MPELFAQITNELHKIATWYGTKNMSANRPKTKYIIFHNKGKTVNTNGLD